LLLATSGFLNPGDIASLAVLQDASSTAIYGSRGANGVIIITTKKGRKGQAARVDFDANWSVARVEKYLPYATASQYMVLKNRNQTALNSINGTSVAMPYSDADIAAAGRGTDWQREVTRLGFVQNYNINVTGGGEKHTYGLSGGYFDQQGVKRASAYKRTNFRFSTDYDAAPWATIGSNVQFIYERRVSEPGSILSSALRALPTAPVRDPDDPELFFGPVDEIGKSGNPVASLHYNSENFANYYKTLANVYVNLKIAPRLVVRSTFTLDNSNSEHKAFLPSYRVNDEQRRVDNQLDVDQSRTFRWLNENTISWSFEQSRHRFDAVAGVTLQEHKSSELKSTILRLPDSAWKNRDLWYLKMGQPSTLTGESSGTNYAYVSYLARANYSFDNRYMVTATVRVDGSSRFPAGGRYGTFPAVGVGWNVDRENFMASTSSWLSQLKLRASWGIVGSDAGIPNNVQTVYVNTVTGVFGRNPASATVSEVIDAIVDYNLSWEEAHQLNLGFDMGAFNNRLRLEFDFFNKTTRNIITPAPFPGVSGTSYEPLFNIATARNRGVEFNLGWRDDIGELSYRMNLVGSMMRNKVTKTNRDLAPLEYGVSRVLVGYPIGGFWGYEVNGIYQDQASIDATPHLSGAMPGDIWYNDQNGDGTIDTNDRVYMGSYMPKATLGFNFGIDWKGISFTTDLYANLGSKIYSLRRQTLGTPNYNVSWDDFKNSWTGPGSTNSNTRVLTDGTGTNNQYSKYFVEDGSYFRIRNVVLGYNLPQKWVSAMHMRNMQVYVAANNLLTVSKATGYSPEPGSDADKSPIESGRDEFDKYPAARTFSIGVKIGF
jgi:TonB-linked SusC/RagA family outer membrane protein